MCMFLCVLNIEYMHVYVDVCLNKYIYLCFDMRIRMFMCVLKIYVYVYERMYAICLYYVNVYECRRSNNKLLTSSRRGASKFPTPSRLYFFAMRDT